MDNIKIMITIMVNVRRFEYLKARTVETPTGRDQRSYGGVGGRRMGSTMREITREPRKRERDLEIETRINVEEHLMLKKAGVFFLCCCYL